MKTEIGKAKITKVTGNRNYRYSIQIREPLGYSSPRPAKTMAEAKAIAAKAEACYTARIARLTARNEAQA